jgi:hypothetical protein
MATASTNSKTSSAQASAPSTQTEMSTAIQESKTGTITRDFAAFSIFKKPEMITGIKGLVTLQPLNKGKEAGWFLDSESLETCKWSATADDFNSGRFTIQFGLITHFDLFFKVGLGGIQTRQADILYFA